ncbi:carboxypeptidase-like regulatory domain-containing protein, partial [Proteiniphilum sp. UBA5280]
MTTLKRILLLFFILPALGVSAQHYTISGYITDKETGEQLISATVFDELSAKGNATNNFGFFSLTLPKGEVSLAFSYIGYQPEKQSFVLQRDTVVNIQLTLQNVLQEVTVVGHRSETG